MPEGSRRRTLLVATRRVAVVAGVFCAVLAGLLWFNGARIEHGDERIRLVEAEVLAPLKARLREDPGNAALKEEIRALDQQLRLEYFRREGFAGRGGYLLLGGAVLFIAALHLARHLRGDRPAGPAPGPMDRRRSAGRAGAAVGGSLALLVGMAATMVGGRTRQWWPPAAVTPAGDDPAPSAQMAGMGRADEAWWPEPAAWAANWPRFRGPEGTGVAEIADLPPSWDGGSGDNVLWKTAIPLPGENSPVVWGERIFLTGASADERVIYGIDAASGAILWEAPVSTPQGSRGEPPQVMEETGFAAPTAVTDGRHVVAMFANGEIAGVGIDGEPLWARHLGAPDNPYGHATSLAMWRNLVIVVYDRGSAGDGKSRILALDVASGETRWSTDRPVSSSWVTPLVIEHAGQPQVLTAADPWIIAYDPADGAELWKLEAMSGDVAPSPAYHDGVAWFASDGSCLIAVDVAARGGVADHRVRWRRDEDDYPDVCSLLGDGQRVYTLVFGRLFAYDAATGKALWEHDLEDDFQASPSLVNGRLWLLTREGEMIVGEAGGDGFRELARHPLGEEIGASPAFGPGRVYLRGREHLYAMGSDGD